jgi:hypothetical protein
MHLIFSNIITEKRLWSNNSVAKNVLRNRPSMAYSTLESIRNCSIDSADFYLEFDDSTLWSRNLIIELIQSLPFQSKIFDYRLGNFSHWREAASRLGKMDSRQVMLFTNEDHYLIPSALGELELARRLVEEIQEANPNKIIMLPLSHFPETHALIPVARLTGTALRSNGITLVPCNIPGGPLIMGVRQFVGLWKSDFTNGDQFVGLENPKGKSLRLDNGFYLPPRIELMRHFDSYGHIRLSSWPYNPINPNYFLDPESSGPPKELPYTFFTDIRNPNYCLDYTIAVENLDVSSLRMSILKSQFIRPSFSGLSYVLSRYPGKRVEGTLALIIMMVANPTLLSHSARAIIVTPYLLILRGIALALTLYPEAKQNFLWYLTYGSSIGFARVLKDLARLTLNKWRSKNSPTKMFS